jgi:hypothetical protein
MQPPVYFEVLVSNTSVPSSEEGFTEEDIHDVRYVTSGLVTASEPWDPGHATVIEPVKGNQTNVTLVGEERVWSGRFVHLGIRGTLGNASAYGGGTVAEWSVILEEREEGNVLDDLREDKHGDKDGSGDGEGELKMWVQSGWVHKLWRRWRA